MGGLTNDVRRFWWAVLAIALLTIVTRLPSLLHPHAIDDEETYSVVANVIVDGGRPCFDGVERKPPLLFWTYAAAVEAAGKYSWKALHAVALAWTLATMAGLYVIGRGLFGREVAGMLASRVSRMRRGEPERIRDLTAAQQDEAPFYEAPTDATSFRSRCQQGNCLR